MSQTHVESSVRLLATLYEYRDAAKIVLGSRYADATKNGASMIRAVMAKHGCSELDAALKLGKEVKEHPGSVMIVMASVVEMLEPTLPASACGWAGTTPDTNRPSWRRPTAKEPT